MTQKIRIKKRNGRLENVDINKINKCIERAADGLDEVSVSEVALDASISLYDKIPSSEICSALILSAKSKIEKEPQYSYLAARILLHSLYKEVFDENVDSDTFDYQYRKSFVTNIKKLVKEGRLDERMLSFDLKKLSETLELENDNLFKYLGLQTLYDRYLLKNGVRKESPQAFWMRVAMGLSLNEQEKDKVAIELYKRMSSFLYCPSTPTLFNSGTVTPQLSSCYLSTIGDSIDGIFGGIHEQARLSKHAGGLGVDFSNVRATGSFIKGTHGISSGVVPWMKIFNDTLLAVNQSGLRKGAGCAYLEVFHKDIEDFIDLRKNTGDDRRRCHDMNTASWIPDAFMRAVKNDEDWYLFSPDDVPMLHEVYGEEFDKEYKKAIDRTKEDITNFSVVKAKELWKKMLISLKTTGHPWNTFKDPCNIRYTDKHCGIVHSSNLCLEIMRHNSFNLYDKQDIVEYNETAVCNLSSLNLIRHVKNKAIDYELLADTIRWAVRGLDNVIDINYYPIKSAENSNLRHRPIGLGRMGFQDVLRELNIKYDSDEGVKFADELSEFISYHTILSSAHLAEEKGKYSTYAGSSWSKGILPVDSYNELLNYRGHETSTTKSKMDWLPVYNAVAKHGMRNASVMAVAPTASVSYIQGCSQSIEPDYSVLYVYSNLSGEFVQVNDYFVDRAKKLGIWGPALVSALKAVDGDVNLIENLPQELKDEFRTVFDIDFNKIIECTSAQQKWVDMGISFNIYSDSPSLKYLSDLYFKCWELGLKTTYYLRGKAASKVEKSTQTEVKEVKACSISNPDCESCQ